MTCGKPKHDKGLWMRRFYTRFYQLLTRQTTNHLRDNSINFSKISAEPWARLQWARKNILCTTCTMYLYQFFWPVRKIPGQWGTVSSSMPLPTLTRHPWPFADWKYHWHCGNLKSSLSLDWCSDSGSRPVQRFRPGRTRERKMEREPQTECGRL